MVVNTELKGAIFLRDKEYWGACRRLRIPDETICKVIINILLQGLLFGFSETIDWSPWWRGSREEVNGAVIGAMLQ